MHSEGKEYFEGIISSPQDVNIGKGVQVVECVPTTYDDGSKGKLVLLNVENETGNLREVILAFEKEE